MIEFMVVSPPRGSSTWMANLLCTDKTHCYHDLLNRVHYSEWDSIKEEKTLGVSDTGIGLFPDWLNKHPARKVIIHRDVEEITTSLEKAGLPPLVIKYPLENINGYHVDYKDIHNNIQEIYEFLLQLPFDRLRYEELASINMQPNFGEVIVDKETTIKIFKEIKNAYLI